MDMKKSAKFRRESRYGDKMPNAKFFGEECHDRPNRSRLIVGRAEAQKLVSAYKKGYTGG